MGNTASEAPSAGEAGRRGPGSSRREASHTGRPHGRAVGVSAAAHATGTAGCLPGLPRAQPVAAKDLARLDRDRPDEPPAEPTPVLPPDVPEPAAAHGTGGIQEGAADSAVPSNAMERATEAPDSSVASTGGRHGPSWPAGSPPPEGASLGQSLQWTAGQTGMPQLQASTGESEARQLIRSIRSDFELVKDHLRQTIEAAGPLNKWFVANASIMSIQDLTTTPSAVLETLLQQCDSRAQNLWSDIIRLEGNMDSMVVAVGCNAAAMAMPSAIAGLDNQSQHVLLPQHFPAAGGTHVVPFSAAEGGAITIPANVVARSPPLQPQFPSNAETLISTTSMGRNPFPVQTAVPGARPGPTPAAATPGGAGVAGLWVRDPDSAT